MKRILILSDTHGLLRNEVIQELACCDYVIHAGDINTDSVLNILQKQNNAYIVQGNNDTHLSEQVPVMLTPTIEGIHFLIVHNKNNVPKDLTNIDIVVYGHSHKFDAKEEDGVLWLNPGSCGKRRFNLEITMCRMEIHKGSYQYEKILIKQ